MKRKVVDKVLKGLKVVAVTACVVGVGFIAGSAGSSDFDTEVGIVAPIAKYANPAVFGLVLFLLNFVLYRVLDLIQRRQLLWTSLDLGFYLLSKLMDFVERRTDGKRLGVYMDYLQDVNEGICYRYDEAEERRSEYERKKREQRFKRIDLTVQHERIGR